MPNTEEWCAIIACANKAYGTYGDTYGTAEQYKIVMDWAKRWMDIRDKNREQANAWNKAHPEAHRKHSRDYARRKALKKGKV